MVEFKEISDREYFDACYSGEYMTSHMLAVYSRNPQLYKAMIDGLIPRKDSSVFKFGRAAHAFILGTNFEGQFIVSDGPINEKTGKPFGQTTQKYLDWASSLSRDPVSNEDMDIIRKMSNSVKNNLEASRLLSGGLAERVIRSDYEVNPGNSVKLQCKMDYVKTDESKKEITIVDLKTCQSLNEFTRDFDVYGYGKQMAFYKLMAENAADDGWTVKVALVAVEKQETFRSGVFVIDDGRMEEFESGVITDISNYATSLSTGDWPSLFDGVTVIR